MNRSIAISLCDSKAEEAERRGVARSEKTAIIALIGDGICELSTALRNAQNGLLAHLRGAQHIGFGGSGRNVGLAFRSPRL